MHEHKYRTLADKISQHQSERDGLEAELLAQKRALQQCFRRVFNGDDGKRDLTHLDSRFRRGPIAVPGDAVSTHVRVGERNVIEYIVATLEQEVEHVSAEDVVLEP